MSAPASHRRLQAFAPGSALWRGEWIAAAELGGRLASLPAELRTGVGLPPAELPTDRFVSHALAAAARLSERLGAEGPVRARLIAALAPANEGPSFARAEAAVRELAEFLAPANLERKLGRELASGGDRALPFRFERTGYGAESPAYEAWAPLGFVVHVAPTNAENVPFLSLFEGLLAGNAGFVKLGADDSDYPLLCLAALLDTDETGSLAGAVSAARFPSSRRDWLAALLAEADGVAAWGSEEAVAGLRALAPPHARFVDWGPKISFAYVTREKARDPIALARVAASCVAFEQAACSSPQVVYLEAAADAPGTRDELTDFAQRLAAAIGRASAATPRTHPPDSAERAELTRVRLLAELSTCAEAPGGAIAVLPAVPAEWLVIAETAPGLRASPLFRSVWVKPLPATEIVATLRPLRAYLQTVGLAAEPARFAELSARFFRAGALRVTPPDAMLGSYAGEPHDGVYALQRYSRRLSVQADPVPFRSIAALDELLPAPGEPATASPEPVLTKTGFAARPIDPALAQLFFKSGGSSGEPQLSVFSYADYHLQMKLAAQGLLAAGLDSARDRVMNLLFAGGLYGGFVSFFTILEELGAAQFPMAAHPDFAAVARTIADRRVDSLIAMPSYLAQLFLNPGDAGDTLRRYRGVRKVFYGGEHFPAAQRARLESEFGVELIRSAAYGSNDIGPMGFQCVYCPGTVHHLHSALQTLEILALDRDAPAAAGEAGRLVFTSRARRGQRIARYEIGDLGRWIEPGKPCACGRRGARFELLGRFGDVFKAGGMLLNYARFVAAASELAEFSGELQLLIERRPDGNDRLALRFADAAPGEPDATALAARLRTACLEGYPDLRETVVADGALEFVVLGVASSELARTPGSGKLRHVIDARPGEN